MQMIYIKAFTKFVLVLLAIDTPLLWKEMLLAAEDSVPKIPATTSPASAAESAMNWPPEAWAKKLQEDPKSDVDRQIKDLITDFETRIAKLTSSDALEKANLQRLRHKLKPLYLEYNLDKKRYESDHFNVPECTQWLTGDMKRWLDEGIEKGKDPAALAAGKWCGRSCWIEGTKVMGRYDLIVPKNYDPAKTYPIIFCFQDSPDQNQISNSNYFLIRSIQKGYPKGFVQVEMKVKSFLKDVSADFNIDPFRIYATGFSFGGHTALSLAIRFPHWFAGIVPICNDLRDDTASFVKHLKQTPTLLLHGTNDDFLTTGKKIHEWMTASGCPVTWDTYPGGHDPGVPFHKDVTMITSFMDRNVLDPYPKTVTKIIEHKRYSRAFWIDAKLIKDGANFQARFEARVKERNRIEIDVSDDIASCDLFLNEELVDMAKPVIVVCKEQKLFEGVPPTDTGKITVHIREGADYWRENTTPLWEELMKIRREMGFAYQPVHAPKPKTEKTNPSDTKDAAATSGADAGK